jgi:hypothetical protein
MTSGNLARGRRSYLLFYDDDVMVVVVVEFSLFLFGDYFQINLGLSRW